MITLKKVLSALLISILLIAVTGVSFSRHICFSGKSVTCAKNESCCKDEHSDTNIKKPRCCAVQNVYLKADIVTTHDNSSQKFFPENFIAGLINPFFISPMQVHFTTVKINHKPPLLQSSRSILLDSSRLTV